MDSRVSSSLEDKNLGEPPEVTPENDKERLLDSKRLSVTKSMSAISTRK
jgi:hypothetical protein